jgi:hypothetical protein
MPYCEGGEQKKSKFYNLTEPYFKSLTAIMLKRWGDWVKNGGVSLSFSLVLD